jgi:L-serine/L-threonine ammonia-lyase
LINRGINFQQNCSKMNKEKLHIATPLIQSQIFSNEVAGNVWLKIEALQPSGSFKLRGIGNACQTYQIQGAKRFISSSGGNAGIAVAYSGNKLNIPVTVVVPESTPERSVELIKQQNAEVIVDGKIWQEAHQFAMNLLGPNIFYIHPFDNPLLWQGHASMIDEVVHDGLEPDVVILSVGGGGLLCGVIEGLHKNNLADVPIIAVETEGADSLAHSIKEGKHAELENITSIATSLGAKKIAGAAYQWNSRHKIISHVVSDRQAINACLQFCLDQRILVEPACGATLAVLYSPIDFLKDKENILVIVCGGAGVSIEQLEEWDKKLE